MIEWGCRTARGSTPSKTDATGPATQTPVLQQRRLSINIGEMPPDNSYNSYNRSKGANLPSRNPPLSRGSGKPARGRQRFGPPRRGGPTAGDHSPGLRTGRHRRRVNSDTFGRGAVESSDKAVPPPGTRTGRPSRSVGSKADRPAGTACRSVPGSRPRSRAAGACYGTLSGCSVARRESRSCPPSTPPPSRACSRQVDP